MPKKKQELEPVEITEVKEPMVGDTLVMSDGTRHQITGLSGKYVICGKTQFRLTNANILKYDRESAPKMTWGNDDEFEPD